MSFVIPSEDKHPPSPTLTLKLRFVHCTYMSPLPSDVHAPALMSHGTLVPSHHNGMETCIGGELWTLTSHHPTSTPTPPPPPSTSNATLLQSHWKPYSCIYLNHTLLPDIRHIAIISVCISKACRHSPHRIRSALITRIPNAISGRSLNNPLTHQFHDALLTRIFHVSPPNNYLMPRLPRLCSTSDARNPRGHSS